MRCMSVRRGIMVVQCMSLGLYGIDAYEVAVEADISEGMPVLI